MELPEVQARVSVPWSEQRHAFDSPHQACLLRTHNAES
jgi:hypothetical protein